MKIPSTYSTSPRHSSLHAKSPLGRNAYGPWSGAFGSSPSGCDSPKTIFVSKGGQCFGDLDGNTADVVPLHAESGELSSDEPGLECWDPAAEDAPGGRETRDVAVLLGLPGQVKGDCVPAKEKAARTAAASAPRCSNKLLRKMNSLQQPRRQN